MKDRIHPGAVIIMMMMMITAQATVQAQPTGNLFPAAHSRIVVERGKQLSAFTREDSLFQLQRDHLPVYNHILHEFENVESLHYSVEGKTLLVSFTSNNHKILAVYSARGKFRYSIAYIGLALPPMITEKLKKEYPAYSVYYGKEIRAYNKNLYEVVIENQYDYRVIKFVDAEMEEVKKLKK